jgi:hypothetical protein
VKLNRDSRDKTEDNYKERDRERKKPTCVYEETYRKRQRERKK